MGRYIIKAEKDVDFYVEWSTIVDNWVFAGTRQDMLDDGISEERLDRADKLGSSFMLPDGRWDDPELIVHNLPKEMYEGVEGYYTLPRENLSSFVQETSDDENIDIFIVRELLVLNQDH